MAQLGRALASGVRGRWFKSSHPDQITSKGFLHLSEAPLFYYGAIRDSLALAARAVHAYKALEDMMRIPFLGGIGVPELIIILIVVLLIFGPKNLHKLGNAIGRTFKSLRDGMDGKKKDDESEKTVESESEPAAEAEEKRDEALEDKVVDGDVVVETDEAPAKKAE